MTQKHIPLLFSATSDPEIDYYIQQETVRQNKTINLIASENYTSNAVLRATGSVLTNKYAEGYPSKRYYGGCVFVDEIELLAQNRCKALFGAEHANVQPHAGSQANLAALSASGLQLSSTTNGILSMSMESGGHLTHGSPVSIVGKMYNISHYSVDPETELLDYDALARLARTVMPRVIIAGSSAYSRAIDFKKFADIAHEVGALLLVDMAHIAGLIAAGLHQSPISYADIVTSTTHKTLRGPRGAFILSKKNYAQAIDRAVMPEVQGGPFMHTIAAKATCFAQAMTPEFVEYQRQIIRNSQALARALQNQGYDIVSGGTDTHMFVVKLHNTQITGQQATIALERAGITVSKSSIPGDNSRTWGATGIRLGTAAVTTRGMKEPEMERIADWIHEVITNHTSDTLLKAVKNKVESLCAEFEI